MLAEICEINFVYLLYNADFFKVVSNMACVCGFQVVASDVNQDGLFETLAIDNSGNIACKNLNGKMVSIELLNFPTVGNGFFRFTTKFIYQRLFGSCK